MFNILPRLESEFPWLHSRPGSEDDFERFTTEKGITVIYRPDVPKGVWAMSGGQHFILLNSSLRGWLLRYVMFHEVGHFLFHVPTQSHFEIEFCSPHVRRKQHIEAEQVAALCLLPMSEIENVYSIGAQDEYAELADLIALRETLRKELNV